MVVGLPSLSPTSPILLSSPLTLIVSQDPGSNYAWSPSKEICKRLFQNVMVTEEIFKESDTTERLSLSLSLFM